MIYRRSHTGARLLACLLTLLSALITPLHAAQIEPLDHIVAVVDEDVIVQSEVDDMIRSIAAQIREGGGQLPSREVLQKQVLEKLIMQKLQLVRASQLGISASEELLAQTISNIARRNGMPLTEFRQALEESGISFRDYRDKLRDEITIQRLMDQEVRRRIQVSDKEIQTFLSKQAASSGSRSEYHLLHILIATPEVASTKQGSAAHDKATQLVERLRGGLDFRTAAINESDDQLALEGGDLGWRPANQLPTLLVDAVADLEKGEIADPVRSPSGYHIIKLEDYKGGEQHIINQTHVRHILIKTNEVTSEDDARTRLQQLRQRILGGDDFEALARSNSDDKSSAINGGDLGWLAPNDTVPRFEEEMDKLPNGGISEPFRTDFGWHIIQLLDRRDYDSTETVQRAEAKQAITNRKFTEESFLYRRRLRDEAYVEIRDSDSS
jgi:peptidyl-prolyl cis-trans isomerase SurA